MNTVIKICGITNLEDALAAVDAGADRWGFNFYRRSSRYIEPEVAHTIIDQLPEEIITVGVFVNEALEEITRIQARSGVMLLQLHGDETPEYCQNLRTRGSKVLKVFHTGKNFTREKILEYDTQLIMVDASAGSIRGGTGKLSDWSQAAQAKLVSPFCFLAGGLSASNVVAAINEVEPFAVDACSSLEQEPGKKDHNRMRDFVAVVRETIPVHDQGKNSSKEILGTLRYYGIL